ncbi:hypothetical protein WN55_06725 [Dufourea novaeangliae]|uniref:Uncharacterized protein n=1 Tax=Dufourea novaeangliae TaxID=178035 RepID=A0A154PQS5_DUFNO|nr:hypothetical protein WN55_06725 [Dufourea novaeangliae]
MRRPSDQRGEVEILVVPVETVSILVAASAYGIAPGDRSSNTEIFHDIVIHV